MKGKFDFGGYATKVGIRCSDGRTISKDAFIENDGQTVPLVWQHMHNDVNNVLGHAILENKDDGVYAYCVLNNGAAGQQAREVVKHGDVTSLSIYANSLVEKGKIVIHGIIREVSLVLAGANVGAKIDNIAFEHSDGSVVQEETEAIIQFGSALDNLLVHADSEDDKDEATDKKSNKTVGEIFQTLNDDQKMVVYAMIGNIIDAQESKGSEVVSHKDKGDKSMKKNVFDKSTDNTDDVRVLSHDELKAVFADAQRCGSLREAFLQHDYGIENIDFLFPDAKTVTPTPTFIKRDTDWVKDVFGAAHHTPFSRIKSLHADITADEARAKGYIKGHEKTEEVITLLKRSTGPTTVYKKQKLDRDDIVDIVDLDVVAWLKVEMRMMLDEELARAILVGDGRSTASDDKIREDCIRPIYSDAALYSERVILPATATTMQIIDQVILSRKLYKGSGNPVFFATPDIVGDMLLLKDTTGRRLYNTINDLSAALRVSKIVEVPVLENVNRDDGTIYNLVGIIVNMKDYYVGADKGGAVSMFDDFDIDYNQFKYLIETRCSGALVTPKSALVIEKAAS